MEVTKAVLTARDPDGTERVIECNATGDLFVELVNPSGESQTDDITGALTVIDIVHHEVHEGEFFSVSYKAPDASPVVDDGTIVFVIETGSKYCHLIADGAMGGDAQLELRENVTFSGGTAMTERNHKRSGGDAVTAAVTRDPTINNAGVLLEDLFLPGGTGGNAVGIQGNQREEWILALNTTYMVRLTNRAGNNQPGSLRVSWYEESDN